MTQDEIIELARQAGFKMENSAAIQAAETFAKLVAEKEREACANLIRWTDLSGLQSNQQLQNYTATLLDGYIKAIRARGQG